MCLLVPEGSQGGSHVTRDDRQVGEHHTVHQRRERLQPLPGGKGAREGGREGGREQGSKGGSG